MRTAPGLTLAAALLLLPQIAAAERTRSPDHATVFIRIVGSLHAEIVEGGLRRTEEREHVEIGTGSGFIISQDGYVLTNEHVVNLRERVVTRGAYRARITPRVERLDVCFAQALVAMQRVASACAEASVTASDATLDLAILMVGAGPLPYIPLGDSDVVSSGLQVDALGYPFGRDVEVGRLEAMDIVPEVSTSPGAVSALRADDTGERRYLQITNTLNPGNSGGPVVDRDGFAIGVIRMQLAKGAGIGFAIPINEAKEFLEVRGLAHVLPARRMRLGPFQRFDDKRIGLRLVEGTTDRSPFRWRVQPEPQVDGVTLRVDRVFSPWGLTQIEQVLVTTQMFERISLSPAAGESRSRLPKPGLLLGGASGAREEQGSQGSLALPTGPQDIRMEYAVLDLGDEKLVARYFGPTEQVKFNQGVLRESLISLAGDRLIAADVITTDRIQWGPPATYRGQQLWPMPSGWIAEISDSAPCAGLPSPAVASAVIGPHDFTLSLRATAWVTGDVSPETAAAACSTRRGSLGAASYASREQFLGVSYSIEGVFLQIGPQHLVRLEVLAREQQRAGARALLAAWMKKTMEGQAPVNPAEIAAEGFVRR